MSRGTKWLWLWLAALLGLRTIFGLVSDFWSPDELQIYLIGLKYSTTGQWPYLGPDVIYTQSQIPGALQGLLVGLPLRWTGIPEAPAVLLNLMSFAALAVFAWYCSRRFPGIPRWFVWGWLLTCPWVLVFSTHVVNPSYALPFAVVFFLGLFETLPLFEDKLISERRAFLLQGLATTCVMQLHLSWVLFPPMTAVALFFVMRSRGVRTALVAAVPWAVGLLVGVATLLPTILLHGVGAGSGGVARNVVLNPGNLTEAGGIVLKFLGFASFEVPYMLGLTTQARLALVKDHLWVAPFAAVLLVFGFAQAGYYGLSFLRRGDREWTFVRWFTLATLASLCLSFVFSVKGPFAHTFYVLFPLANVWGFLCLQRLLGEWRSARVVLGGMLACGVAFHVAIALHNFETRSLYRDRARVVEAIGSGDYRVLGLRRADEWGHGY